MGRKFTIPYGLYRAHGFINPFLAEQTGFTDDDLVLFWDALINAFQFDQSAARPAGSMASRALIVFEHENARGNAPSHELLDRVSVTRENPDQPPRNIEDYRIEIADDLPDGVILKNMIS